MAADDYDEFTREVLSGEGLSTNPARTKVRSTKNLPYNTAGLPSLRVRDVPELEDTNTRGFVVSSNVLKNENRNRGASQDIFLAPSAKDETVAHEAEHLLARQNTGFTQTPREKFDELGGPGATRSFLNGLQESLPYLREKYGIDNGYMDPEFIREQGRVGMYEILATLAGTEAAKRVDLTKDPELRKTLFKDKNVREAYNAVTGLRQTRLDPRDIPPYTRVPEKDTDPGMVDKLRQMFKFAEGGYVPEAGNKKLI